MPKVRTDDEWFGPSQHKAPASSAPTPPRPPTSPTRPRPPIPDGTGGRTTPETPQELKSLMPKPELSQLLPAKGKARFERFLASAPPGAAPGSQEWDTWYLRTFPTWQDANDPEFTQLIQQTTRGVVERTRKRQEEEEKRRNTPGQGWSGLRAKERAAEEARLAREKVTDTARETRRGNMTVTYQGNELLGPDFKPKGELTGEGGRPGPPESQTEALAPSEELDAEDIGATAEEGGYVWMGRSVKREGNTLQDKQSFMSTTDAQRLIATYSPQDIAAFQEAFDLPVTGLPDKATQNKWNEAVKIAERFTAVGKKVPLEMVLQIMVNAEQAKKRSRGGGGGGGRGGGGGGGGGGSAGYNRSEVRAFFNAMMQKQVGREATEDEANRFFAAFNGAGDVDPEQYATDWIRGNLSGEAGTFSAVNYYDVVMQLLAGG